MPIQKLRNEFSNILSQSELWDGKINVLQVTDIKDRSIEIRALMSAKDASTLWDLKCEVREKLITYIVKYYSQCLPKIRFEKEK